MIAATPHANQLDTVAPLPTWQQSMRDAITDPAELLHILGLDPAWLPAARAAAHHFPLRAPRSFVARMRPRDPHDPLLRQVLPLDDELKIVAGFSADPVGDLLSRKDTGVLQKYAGRALLIATGACGVHCRYCFRRHFPYAEDNASAHAWKQAVETLRADESIEEAILSGGDPLSLNDRRLSDLVKALDGIAHLRRLRIHTRQPIVLPERVDAAMQDWLGRTRLQKIIVLHANHANEIDASVRAACRRMADSGALLLNQSVLLAGVNDSVAALADLSKALLSAGVLPYYLHLLDRVQGAAHFEVDAAQATELMRALTRCLPGYLLPKLVREIPGEASKTLVPL